MSIETLSGQSNFHEKGNLFIVVSLLACLAVLSPLLTIILVGIIAISYMLEVHGGKALMISLVFFLGLFNATKQIDGDWYWYVSDYVELSRVSLWDFLETGGSSIRFSEPLYYALSASLSRLSGGNVIVLALAVSLAIYLTYIFALEKLLKEYGLSRLAAATCIIFAVFAGITFTLSLQLVRQFIAGSILFFYFSLLLEGKNKKAMLLLVIGTLIHNSLIVPAILLAIFSRLWTYTRVKKHYLMLVSLLLVFGYSLGRLIVGLMSDSFLLAAFSKDDGSISNSVLALDGLLFCVTFAGVIYLKKNDGFYTKCSAISVLFLAFYGGVLFGAHELTLFLLRFYFYLEWFRVIGVITIVWFLVYRLKKPAVVLLIIPLSFLMLEMRVAQSPFDFGGGAFDHLTGSVFWWADNLVSKSP